MYRKIKKIMERERKITCTASRKEVKMIDDKCKKIKCEHYIEWSFGYGTCHSCELQGESYNIEKPAEDRNCPLYRIEEGGEK